jgi:hypothetical protein
MKLSAIVAAIAALGGLVGTAAVDQAVREAAPAAPEKDFRALIDMARQVVNAQVNNGRLDSERIYVSIEAMYSDRIIIEHGGKHYQYPYTIQVINGAEQMVLGSAVQVVGQFVPLVATPLKEAAAEADAAFREAEDGSIEVTIVRTGPSLNGNLYTAAALREAVPLFEGVRLMVKSDAQHLKGEGKDVRSLIGGIYGVRFVEGALPDTGKLVGTFKAIDPNDPVVGKMAGAVKRGMQSLMGLSIDASAKTKKTPYAGRVLREATKFIKVSSVDLIVEPGAGGGLDRLTEAAAEISGEDAMNPELKKRMLEAIKARDAAKHAALNLETVTDTEVMNLYEAVMTGTPPSQTQRVAEAQGDDAPVSRAEFLMLQFRQTAGNKIAASKLPQVAKDKLLAQFANSERFTEAEVDDAIKAEGEYLARFTESGAVRVPMFGNPSIQVGDRSVVIKDMLDAFFDPAHKDHRSVHSFKECYIEMTGDRKVTGLLRDMDQSRLAESLGEAYRESVASSTFANALGNSITRRMQAIYVGRTDLDAWKKVCTWGPVNDFRTQERTRIGGYGNLPAVNEAAGYTALSSPGDDKATYAATKRGGTEDVTLEAIKNDDVQAIRRIPLELALAAKNTLFEFVFDFYRTNPVIYDTLALYHATHGNLFTGAFSGAEFALHRLAMVKQTRAGSAKRMGLSPASVLVPFELQEPAFNAFVRGQNLDKTYVQSINPEVIPVPYWTDATDWVTVADPAELPVVEIGFLDGREEPELFVQDMPNVGSMFSNDKATYKIRHIYGGNVLVDGFKATTKGVVAG